MGVRLGGMRYEEEEGRGVEWTLVVPLGYLSGSVTGVFVSCRLPPQGEDGKEEGGGGGEGGSGSGLRMEEGTARKKRAKEKN